MDRGERRHRTEAKIRRRLETPFITPGREPHRYAKWSPLGCPCSKRTRGRPKVSKGMCEIGSRDRVYHWRGQARSLQDLTRSNWTDWDSDRVAFLASPRVKGD